MEVERTDIKAEKKTLSWSCWIVDPVEDMKIPDYNAEILASTEEADKYRSKHRVTYTEPNEIGWSDANVLHDLWGRPWDQFALNVVASVRPSCIRVTRGEITLDSCSWRVTVILEEDDRTIARITQEVNVGLVGAKHGWGLQKYERGESPQPCFGYINANALKKIDLYSGENGGPKYTPHKPEEGTTDE